MTLSTHTLVAGAVGLPLVTQTGPAGIFLAGLASHYLIDAIPHYDYDVGFFKKSVTGGPIEHHFDLPTLATGIGKVALDLALGIGTLWFVWQPIDPELLPFALAVAGGLLPDALQALYAMRQIFPLTLHQDLHDFFHAKRRLDCTPFAVTSQLILAFLAIVLILLRP